MNELGIETHWEVIVGSGLFIQQRSRFKTLSKAKTSLLQNPIMKFIWKRTGLMRRD